MHSPSQSSFFSIFSIFIFFILNHLQKSSWAQAVEYQDCTTRKIQCGNLKDIGYPFYGENRPKYCGHPGFELNCNDDHLEISIMSQMLQIWQKFYVIDINDTSHTLTLAREDYYYNYCPSTFINTAINLALFNYTQTDANITFHYGCSPANLCPFQCTVNGEAAGGYFSIPNIASGFDDSQAVKCTYAVIVPVYRSAFAHNEEPGQNVTITTVRQALENGFELKWYADNEFCYDECLGKGECGYDWVKNKAVCYCPEEYQSSCPSQGFVRSRCQSETSTFKKFNPTTHI
ncbi:hypothetical protein Ancab_034787 [Ancistrocladus abbreviatus]